MAYYEFGSDESIDEMIEDLSGNRCFLCRKEFDGDVVYWHGSGTLAMHPKCARKLGQNLIFDSYAVNRKIEVMNILKDLEK